MRVNDSLIALPEGAIAPEEIISRARNMVITTDAVRQMVDTRIANIAVADNENVLIRILNQDGYCKRYIMGEES